MRFRLPAAMVLLLVAAAGGPASAAVPQLAQATAVPVDVAAKIERARERGYWVVEEGDYLHRISRYFVAAPGEVRALSKELEALNPNALINGDPARLVVGARLRLPERLVTARANVAPPAAAPSAARPEGQVAASPPAAKPAAPAASPAPAPANAAPRAAYVDRLIEGGTAAEEESLTGERVRSADDSRGLRSYGAELRTEHRDTRGGGSSNAEGLGLRVARETERYGDLALVTQLAHVRPDAAAGERERTRVTATLFHDNFAIGDGAVANSALGVIQPTLPAWLSTSYRVLLAPSLLAGGSTIVSAPNQEWRVAGGAIGRYAGVAVQQFERTSGHQAFGSFTRLVDADTQLGFAAITMRGNDAVRDHEAASFALQRNFAQPGDGVKVQAALTDGGQGAAWLDGQVRSGRLTQRFGAYHADPDFRFGESATTRDVRGAYWRGDYRLTGDYYGGGVEAYQENLKRDPARGGNDSVGAFGNLALRLDRNTQVGGGFSARSEDARVPTGIDRHVFNANAFVSRRWMVGLSRLDWNGYESRPRGLERERTHVVNWTQEWPALASVEITTLLGYTDERLIDRRTQRRTASLALRGPLAGTVHWNATVTAVDVDQEMGGERNYNATAGIDWSPSPEWSVQLNWYRNQVQPGPDNPLVPFQRENAVQLNVRYETTVGSPYPRIDGAGGRSGAGAIAGSVFYDENGDGVRGPTERGAPGVTLILDDRQSAMTRPDGRFVFALVPAGPHRVRVLVERVALPWGLEDEGPRALNVTTRGESRLDIGLTRIAP